MPATLIRPTTVPGKLMYFSPPKDGSRPIHLMNEDASQASRYNFVPEEKTVDVENIRGKEDAYSLSTSGFQFCHHPAKHTSFSSDEEIEREYYPESIEFLKELTGASKVVLFDHTIRRRRPGELETDASRRQPVALVHADQTDRSARTRLFRHFPEEEAKELVKKRFQIINLWRPISHTAWDWPLALCDYRTIDRRRDLVPTALVYPEHEGETLSVRYHPDHRWKYMKGMTTDELVLIKCYDTVQDGSVAILTPHTAFEDPFTPEGSPLRESIELRALLFFD
ncbi:hypothetical protein D9757_006633 [Collybiopsis confluens]|uniref:7alpha-cephem-methoxylase P8 chain n=1 Tax=Collybiopsis confluens TaxID=2823264 RepID=A0A8H5MA54_9AGAR|nr:hypothetical protein D9757_006633 [Collybiopsis confluens]